MDLAFDREVMEKILDLSPTGIDEVMALTRVMEFLEQGHHDLLVLDSAPTGHLIRLLELPELIDRWLKVFFGLFLKYKRIFRLPGISSRMVRMSKDLKRLRTLLHDPQRSSLVAVSILTEMALQETADLVKTCGRMQVGVPVLFLNGAAQESDCTVCSAVCRREAGMLERFEEAFPGMHQAVVYQQGEPRGLQRLERLGAALYGPAQKESVRL
jgi:arsenite-transporting ATPase